MREPGIGKTRLVQELADVVRGRGAGVCWGACDELEGAPPYWPWLQAIRAYIDEQMGHAANVVGGVLPELRKQRLASKTPRSRLCRAA